MTGDEELREQLVEGLNGGDSHMPFEDAVAELPGWAINGRAPHVAYTPWHLVEHLRLTQWDMLEYVRDPAHVSPPWPSGYWPDAAEDATEERFAASVAAFLADRAAFEALLRDPALDLLAPIAHAPEHTIARCARIIANHNSYHVGELGSLREVMGSWGPGH